MAEETKDTPEGGAKKKPSLLENKALLLGGIVILQAVLAFGLTQFVIMPRLGAQAASVSGPAPAEAETAPPMGVIVSLEEIITTLPDSGVPPRYLRVTANLEVADQVTADLVAARLPQLRDIVIMTVSDLSADVLISPAGKKALRDELARRLAAKLPAKSLLNIYFSDLVIQ